MELPLPWASGYMAVRLSVDRTQSLWKAALLSAGCLSAVASGGVRMGAGGGRFWGTHALDGRVCVLRRPRSDAGHPVQRLSPCEGWGRGFMPKQGGTDRAPEVR